ncbi:MAG: hypothetical protein DSY58_07485 [Desulfobulbus sp.]|nr:MAG: hypothetical protein DSY58_07485 [Desulfobulbus sp.]RUM38642.1 MAG: hypothetical protein DSY70_07390 [Desulfobulbus sp.]
MKKTLLITGGTGILGKHLVTRFLANGHRVTILCRNPKPDLFPTSNQPRWLQGDVSLARLGLEQKSYQSLVKTTDTVFHLAARTDFKGKNLEAYTPVNINGVRTIYSFAAKANAPLHHVSTAFVCGRQQGTLSEQMLDRGQKFRNFYEESKFRGECFLRKQQAATALPITIYRPSIILERQPDRNSGGNFGPFTFLDAIFRLLLSLKRQQSSPEIIRVQGCRESSMPFIFDDDAAETIYTLSNLPEQLGKTFHLTTASSFANNEIENLFNQAFGRQVVCWANAEDILKNPLRPAEELLARRTKVYADYLDLNLDFTRANLDDALGAQTLPDLSTNEVLTAFSRFLACRKTGEASPAPLPGDRTAGDITLYFTRYLPEFLNRPMLQNLVSLNTLFWLKIQTVGTWSIQIGEGCLRTIKPGKTGAFGYTVTPDTFLKIVRGQRSPQEGFFQGQIAINGDTREGLRTATALEEFFSTYPYQEGSCQCQK